jgi:hypothetical protein
MECGNVATKNRNGFLSKSVAPQFRNSSSVWSSPLGALVPDVELSPTFYAAIFPGFLISPASDFLGIPTFRSGLVDKHTHDKHG